jgi:beta-lactamase regulating signal transducer with metallopeptidase domain
MCILWIPVAIILRVYVSLQVKPRFVRKECQLRIDRTFDERQLTAKKKQKKTASLIGRLQGVAWITVL